MAKTVSIRMDEENYAFLHKLAKEEREDLSKAVREVVYKGRVMLAIEKYKKGQASLGKAAELAGLSVGQMITLLAEYGVPSNLETEDYLQGLEHLRKVW
jgi:predicted HTH domain antitoxin